MSPTTEEIRRVIERYAAAWSAGDLGAIVACYHNDFTLHYFGQNALAGVHVGKAASLGILAEFSRRTARRLVAVDAVLAGPERGALMAREVLGKGSAAVEVERLFVYAVRDGLLSECWIYDQDQRLIDRLLGSA